VRLSGSPRVLLVVGREGGVEDMFGIVIQVSGASEGDGMCRLAVVHATFSASKIYLQSML
jgi:hypothetical protein